MALAHFKTCKAFKTPKQRTHELVAAWSVEKVGASTPLVAAETRVLQPSPAGTDSEPKTLTEQDLLVNSSQIFKAV